MRFKSIILIFAVLGINASAVAQNFKNEFGFKSDNDAYLWNKQDQYYTNGLFIYFRHAAKEKAAGQKLEKLIYEFSTGQKIYNPISGYLPNPIQQDRPFAAYLYAGANLSFFYTSESVLKVGLEIGTIGPNALGKAAQTALPQLIGFYEIKGWDYQIKNDFGVNFAAQHTKLLYRNATQSLDLSLESYANIGTTFSAAGLGVLARTGNMNPLFNSASTNARLQNKVEKVKSKNEFFFYAKPQLNVIAYDATISGSMFNNTSPITFKTKPLVFAQQLGVNYSTPRFSIDYHFIYKSKEVKSTAKAHQFGSIAMLYRFN